MPKPTRYYSKRQESRVANELGAKMTPNSGATAWSKGDVTGDDILIECKTLTKEQKVHSIKKEWLEGIEQEAINMRKRIPILVFDYGTQLPKDQYAVLRMRDLKMLLELYNNIEEE